MNGLLNTGLEIDDGPSKTDGSRADGLLLNVGMTNLITRLGISDRLNGEGPTCGPTGVDSVHGLAAKVILI